VYELFKPAPPRSQTAVRTEIAVKALGAEVVAGLHQAAHLYGSARVPDLMAWREREGRKELRFIESKNERRTPRGYYVETVKPGQLLGLALIALVVPDSHIHIYRWLESGQYRQRLTNGTLRPKAYAHSFLPR
jgi:hypothetical protein